MISSQGVSGTVGDTTLSISQIPSHSHGGGTGTWAGTSGWVEAGRAGDIGPFLS